METNDPQLADDLEKVEAIRDGALDALYRVLSRDPNQPDILALIEIVRSGRFQSASDADFEAIN